LRFNPTNAFTWFVRYIAPWSANRREKPIKDTKDSSPGRGLLGVALPLLALWNFAYAQPLFDLLVANNTYLVAHGLLGWPLLVFTVAVSVLSPILMLLAWSALTPLHSQLRWLPRLVAWGLTAVIFMQLFRAALVSLTPMLELLVALTISAVAVRFLKDNKATVSFLRLAAIGALIFPVLFLIQLPGNYLLQSSAASTTDLNARSLSSPLPDIVLVVFDELALTTLLNDKLEIDADRYPNFARFASVSTWYSQASSSAAGTRVVIPALLSGTTPSLELSPDAASHPENLFSFAAPAYTLRVEEPITKLCDPEGCRQSRDWQLITIDTAVLLGYMTRFRLLTQHLPPVGGGWIGFLKDWSPTGEDARIISLERFLEGLKTREGPNLQFLHLVLPHIPYTILPSGQRLFRHGAISGHIIDDQGDRFVDQPWAVTEARELYEWQLRFVDQALGRVLDTLGESGRYDDALVIITADHGVRFAAGKTRREPTSSSFVDIASVPLFVKYPHQTAARQSAAPLQSTDLLGLIKHVVMEGAESDDQWLELQKQETRESRRMLASQGWVELPLQFDFAERENPSRASIEAARRASLSGLQPAKNPAECMPGSSFEPKEPQLYSATHPEHFLAAHIVFQLGEEVVAASEFLVLEFNGASFWVQKTGAERYSSFVDPGLFNPGFNRVRLLDYRSDGVCTLYDNDTSRKLAP